MMAAWVLLLAAGQANQPKSGGPPLVICQPCTEVPPPKGYLCANKVLVSESVRTADFARVTAACSAATPSSKPGKKLAHHKHHHKVSDSK